MQTSISQATGLGQFPPAWGASTATPDASSSASADTNSSSDSSATITSNDFLQLLVTEMQNQDPTADTDPNEYINQLVQVNSLQQLIQINSDLGGNSSTSSTSGDSASTSRVTAEATKAASQATGQNAATSGAQTGNLSEPEASAAAVRVAHALAPPAAGATDLQNFVHTPGNYAGAAQTNIGIAR
ncbi:MAG: flagellar hook capping FlgD N-terminal domain-containing protein [Acidobacteriaceae bacterium]